MNYIEQFLKENNLKLGQKFRPKESNCDIWFDENYEMQNTSDGCKVIFLTKIMTGKLELTNAAPKRYIWRRKRLIQQKVEKVNTQGGVEMIKEEKAKALLDELVDRQYRRATEEHGERYKNLDELDGVLIEEVEEVTEDVTALQTLYTELHRFKRHDDTQLVVGHLKSIRKYSILAIAELCQVAAVCRKGIESFEKVEEK